MRIGSMLLPFVFVCAGACAQSVISAHSGVVHYIEGDVAIDGSVIQPKFGEFPDLKNGQVLATEEGRAEVLLTPGVFLRLAENSSVRMVSNTLSDTQLQVISGSALIEAGELLPDNSITIECAGVRIALPKKGLYGVDAANSKLRVFDGQAIATLGNQQIAVHKSHEIALGETLADVKFDAKETDPFYRWNVRRAEYIAAANVTAAHIESNSNLRSGYAAGSGGAWNWNPYFGMFTFLPASGVYNSPFGSVFYSPGTVDSIFFSPVYISPVYLGPPSLGSRPSGSGGGGFPGASAGAGASSGGGGFPGGRPAPNARAVGARR